MSKTVDETRKALRQLELSIRLQLIDFERDHDTYVSGLDLSRTKVLSAQDQMRVEICTDIMIKP